VTYDRYTGDRQALADELASDRGLTLIPPYDHPHVMAGQGTLALEMLEQTGPLDVMVVPVGGGGLISGCATAAAAVSPRVTVIGVEPELGDDTFQSLASGRRVTIDVPRTIADGQAVEAPGELTFPIIQKLVERIVLVGEDEIRDAMRFAFERLKIVIEPSGATGLAAVLNHSLGPAERIGVVISGGNIGLERFNRLLTGMSSA
jgi:threo-3-hydroxy-L-aspartate ammonia-lyase